MPIIETVAAGVQLPHPRRQAVSDAPAAVALTGLAATAGVIHLVAAAEHVGGDGSLGAFFLLVGAGQLGAARLVHRDPSDRSLLALGAAGSVAIALLWILSRTAGVPFGPDAGQVVSVGVADTIATLLELGFAALAATVMWRGDGPIAWLRSGMGIRLTFAVLSLALMLAVFGGHEH